jgi:8-oxo-dGTP pyrophosphatase MutT (NUDIX family)
MNTSAIAHFTATAIVVHEQKILLMWHKRLQRWMPPGGHMDPNELPEQTAVRECKEETGLDITIEGQWEVDVFTGNTSEGYMQKKPLTMLIENIPASTERNEPAHQHIDFVFLGSLTDPKQALVLQIQEATELRWFTKEQISNLNNTTEIYGNVQMLLLHIL